MQVKKLNELVKKYNKVIKDIKENWKDQPYLQAVLTKQLRDGYTVDELKILDRWMKCPYLQSLFMWKSKK